VYQSYSINATGAAGLHVPLGGIRKRAFDIIIASIALIVLAPILVATAGLIRLLMGKSVLVIDECVGFGGRVFARYQFPSSAHENADISSALLRLNEPSWAERLEDGLRTSRLDKLPLLFNVLRGDMSLIGPRPITMRQLSHYNAQMPKYLLARPGITGVWRRTRKARRASPMALNRYYVRYWSVWLDLGLLGESVLRLAEEAPAAP
jgi:exopolysaccharide production protein ExoY